MIQKFVKDPKYILFQSYAKEIIEKCEKMIESIKETTDKQKDKQIRREIKSYKQELSEIKTKVELTEVHFQTEKIVNSLEPIYQRVSTIHFHQKERKTVDELLEFTTTFSILPRINDQVRFDVAGGSCNNNSDIILWPSHGGSNQSYQIIKCTDPNHTNCFVFRDCHSGKYLGFSSTPKPGTHLVLNNDDINDKYNHFTIEFVEQYFYYIKLTHANLILDIYEEKAEVGQHPIAWVEKKKEESFNQQFQFIPIMNQLSIKHLSIPISEKIKSMGCYHIQCIKDTHLQFDIMKKKYGDVTELKLNGNDNRENQSFFIHQCNQPGHENCVLIKACHSGKYIGYDERLTLSGKKKYIVQNNIEVGDEKNHWNINCIGNDQYSISSAHENLVIECPEVKQNCQPYLVKFKEVNNEKQLFTFISVDEHDQFLFQQRFITHLIHF